MTEQSELDEFGDELAALRTDSSMAWAEVETAVPVIREQADPSVDPGDEGASDQGLAVTFRRASGETFATWFEKPASWDIVASDLVLLLEYWGVDPGDIEQLEADDTAFEIPIEYASGEGVWRPDWEEITRTVHTRQLEEVDDGGD